MNRSLKKNSSFFIISCFLGLFFGFRLCRCGVTRKIEAIITNQSSTTESLYKHVVNALLHIYGDLLTLKEADKGCHAEREFLHDSIIGKIFRLKHSILQLIDSKKVIFAGDVEYIAMVIKKVIQLYKQLDTYKDNDGGAGQELVKIDTIIENILAHR